MKLIGFLLVLFVGMSGVSYGQTDQDSKHIVSDSTISQIVNYFDQQYKLNNSKGVLVYADEVSNELLNLNRHPTERIIRYHRMMAYSAFRLNLYNKAFSYTETAYLHVKNDENTAAESLVNLQLELARYAEYSTSQYEVINYYDQVLLNNDLSTDSLKVLQESIFNSYSFYLNKMQDYPNELRVLNKYLEFYNVHFDSKSIQYQKILYWKGIALINIKRYSAGISVLESLLNEDFGKSPQQRLKYSTEESSELFIWVWLAHSYSKLLDYPNAERAYQKAIELYLNKNEYRSAAVLVNKFISLLRENKNCNRCIEVYENNKFLNQNLSQKEQLNVLYQYVNCLADCERYQDALKICDSVIHGSTDCTIENRCFQFIPLKASLFTQGSNHISAYNIYDSLYTHSSIHLLRENQPDEFIAFSNNYMWCALRMGFRQKHKQLNQELFNFSVKHYKGDKYMLSRVYNSYAAGLFEDYSLDSALINYEIALKLADSAKNKIMMARIYNNMSEPYAEMGMYQTSIQLVDSALQIQKGIALNDNYYTYLNNKGVYLNKSGLFSESIKCYQRRIGYSERTFGSQSDSYLLGRHNLALVYKKVGSFEKASSILLDCYEKNIIKYGSEYNEACAMNLRAMTSLFGVDQENALKFNLRVKEIYDSIYMKKNNPQSLLVNNDIALNYSVLGYHSKSLTLFEKIVDDQTLLLKPTNPNRLVSMLNLAIEYSHIKNYVKEYKYEKEVLDILNTLPLGTSQRVYYTALRNFAINHLNTKDFLGADTLLQSGSKILYKDYLRNIDNLNESERSWFKISLINDQLYLLNYSIFRKRLIPDLYNKAYQDWMNMNGLLNSMSSNRSTQISKSGDEYLLILYGRYRKLSKQISLYNEKPKEHLHQLGIDMIALDEQVALLERELNAKVSGFSNDKKQYTYTDLTKGLNRHEVFIDIIALPLIDTASWNWTSELRYLVNISSPKWDTPKHMVIENAEGLMELSHDYANRIHDNDELRLFIDTSGCYYDQFWAPIAKELKGVNKVYISLDGVYNNINLATLYNKETGKYLFEELDIEIVNSARSFIESKNKEPEQYEDLTAMLLGFPDYDHKPNVEKLEDMKEDYFASSRDITAQLTDSLSRGGRVGSLPGTKTEVKTISQILRKQKWTRTVLMESEASEHAVKRLNSPRLVHMATHGYFLEDIEQDHEDDRMLGMDRNKVIENPMLRSGLLFAGANATLSGKQEQEGENGILTAYEASFLNLENTELVVMSACETARGEQKTGEGVYGLRKAISDAGAEYVMMSLWKVDDKVTQEFMTTFYTYWLEDKMSIREAFKSTRSFVKSKYPQPYYWGAFILVGR